MAQDLRYGVALFDLGSQGSRSESSESTDEGSCVSKGNALSREVGVDSPGEGLHIPPCSFGELGTTFGNCLGHGSCTRRRYWLDILERIIII